MKADNKIRIIGTRHGEKLFETLCTREEMSRAISMDKYYRIPADARDLNYGKYFQSGDKNTSQREDYNSHNTLQLNLEEVKHKLIDLDCIKKEL